MTTPPPSITALYSRIEYRLKEKGIEAHVLDPRTHTLPDGRIEITLRMDGPAGHTLKIPLPFDLKDEEGSMQALEKACQRIAEPKKAGRAAGGKIGGETTRDRHGVAFLRTIAGKGGRAKRSPKRA